MFAQVNAHPWPCNTEECTSCLRQLAGDIYSFPCHHRVHASCGRALAANSNQPLCPLCRQSRYHGPVPEDDDYVHVAGQQYAAAAVLGRPECPGDLILWCCNRYQGGFDRRMHWGSTMSSDGTWSHTWHCYICGRDVVQHVNSPQIPLLCNRLLDSSHCGFHGACALLVDFTLGADVLHYAVCRRHSQVPGEQAEIDDHLCGRGFLGIASDHVPADTVLDPDSPVVVDDSASDDDNIDNEIEMLNVVLGDDSSSNGGDDDIAEQLEGVFGSG